MFNLIVEDKNKNQLYLTGNPAYVITNIDGFDPPEATINTSKNAGADGSLFNSAYANERQITITMVINAPVEQNRINLYKWFKTKFPVKLTYETESRNVYIEGFVQSIQVGYFEKKQTAHIVVLCPKPYLNGSEINEQIFSNIDPLFEFPFSIPAEGVPFSEVLLYVEKSILNFGDIVTGVLIKINALGTIENPKIYNVETREHMILNTNLLRGDVVEINTRFGEKSITLIRDGVESSIVGSLEDGSSWFQLEVGDNVFTLNADSGIENMFVSFTVIDQYEGV